MRENTGGAIFAINHYLFHQKASVKCKEKFFKQTVTGLFINSFFLSKLHVLDNVLK